MSDDAKVDFYLRHRELIEEWAALRAPTASTLRSALWEAGHRLSDQEGLRVDIVESDSSRGRTYVQLTLTDAPLPRVYIEMIWDERYLLERSHWLRWPILAVVSVDPPDGLEEVVAEAVAPHRMPHGLTERGRPSWLWWGRLTPHTELIDPDAYAAECATRALTAWRELHTPIANAVQEWAVSGEHRQA